MTKFITVFALLFVVGCGTAEGSDDLPNVGPAPSGTATGGNKGDIDPSSTGSSCGCEAGPVGPQGEPGADGVDGKNGLDGVDGVDGDSCSVVQGANSAIYALAVVVSQSTGTVRFHRVEYDVRTTMDKIYATPGLPNYLADRLIVGR